MKRKKKKPQYPSIRRDPESRAWYINIPRLEIRSEDFSVVGCLRCFIQDVKIDSDDIWNADLLQTAVNIEERSRLMNWAAQRIVRELMK